MSRIKCGLRSILIIAYLLMKTEISVDFREYIFGYRGGERNDKNKPDAPRDWRDEDRG